MIDKIRIQNFKSVVDTTIELGRVNIIIGENGCGKTNVLEAISFASAASQDKLDFLGNFLRVTKPEFMFSAFENENNSEKIFNISVTEHNKIDSVYKIFYDTENNKWRNGQEFLEDLKIPTLLKTVIGTKGNKEIIKRLDDFSDFEKLETWIDSSSFDKIRSNIPNTFKQLNKQIINKPYLDSFLIYTPEETMLRRFSDETQLLPLGRRGEGLFQYLKELATKEDNLTIMKDITDGLMLLDWFEGLEIPKDLLSNEYRLDVKDRYLNESLLYFDQRSTNEGFLYLLFYLTLFSSKQTPAFFAIDNIETSFNPKLCTKLVRYLIELAKKNNKQVIITTHSPFVLDGLDLSDKDQRLFVARRNIDGHTKLNRIPYKEDRNMILSELWMSGLIGGLPDNF
jgi:AAA15 family ATPase/GTPase